MLDKDIFVKDSWAWRLITEHEERLARDFKQGFEEGSVAQARRMVKQALALLFPDLDPAGIDSIATTARLEALHRRIITASSAAEVEAELIAG